MVDKGFLTGMKDIAAYLNMSENTILKHKRRYANMPIQKIGGVWVGDPEGLSAFYRDLAKGVEEGWNESRPIAV